MPLAGVGRLADVRVAHAHATARPDPGAHRLRRVRTQGEQTHP